MKLSICPGLAYQFLGWRLGGASTPTLKDDASAESSGMSGSVTWTAFLGKEQDVHMHGGVRGLEKAEGGSHRYLSLLS